MRIILFLFLFLGSITSFSQITYTSVSIPMRDGKFLAADYYLPSGCTSCPVILIQTPYQKNTFHNYLPLGVGTDLPNSHYAFVIVDWRGFYGSLSAAVPSPNRGEDGYDVIDWIGGYPYEYASKDEIKNFVEGKGFRLVKFNKAAVLTGCNEFIFEAA